jgi:hypothetical protein
VGGKPKYKPETQKASSTVQDNLSQAEADVESKEEVWEFEKLEQQLYSFLTEIPELSKKKPNDILNKFKLKFINSMLTGLNKLMGKHRPFSDFEIFDVDDIPSNSDVVVILAQYATSAYAFRRDNTVQESIYWYWKVHGKRSDLRTERPETFKYQQK